MACRGSRAGGAGSSLRSRTSAPRRGQRGKPVIRAPSAGHGYRRQWPVNLAATSRRLGGDIAGTHRIGDARGSVDGPGLSCDNLRVVASLYNDPAFRAASDALQEAQDEWYSAIFSVEEVVPALELEHWCWAEPELYEGTYRGRPFIFRERHGRWYVKWGEGAGYLVDADPWQYFDLATEESRIANAAYQNSRRWHAEAREPGERVVAFGRDMVLPGWRNAGNLIFALRLLDLDIAANGQLI